MDCYKLNTLYEANNLVDEFYKQHVKKLSLPVLFMPLHMHNYFHIMCEYQSQIHHITSRCRERYAGVLLWEIRNNCQRFY